jgi:SPP1 family predicted phage head-tail adaptor
MPLRRLNAAPHSIGGMRAYVQFLAPGAPNPGGGAAPPSPTISAWGSISALHGEERDKAAQIDQDIDHLCCIPYQPGITGNMLIVWDQRTFQIKYIEDSDEMKVFLDIYCAEVGQNAGQQS